MTNSMLKVPIVPYNARQYCFNFLLKNERDVQREKYNFEVKSTVQSSMLQFFPVRLSVGVSLSKESIRKLRGYHYSNTSNMYQPFSLLFVREYIWDNTIWNDDFYLYTIIYILIYLYMWKEPICIQNNLVENNAFVTMFKLIV